MPPLSEADHQDDLSLRTRHRVLVLREGGGEDFPFVMRPDGIPALMPHLWLISFVRTSDKKFRTLETYARALAMFEDWFAEQGVHLPTRARQGANFTDAEVRRLVNYLRRISPGGLAVRRHTAAAQRLLWRNRGLRPEETQQLNDENVSVATANKRLSIVCAYLGWLDGKLRDVFENSDPNHKHTAVVANLTAKLHTNISPEKPSRREGLLDSQHRALLGCVLPGSKDKPNDKLIFREAVVHRNFALMTLLAGTGLRLSEALCLKLQDVDRSGGEVEIRVVRRPDDPEDTRKRRPSVKTLERTLKLPPLAAIALNDWLDEHRGDRARFGDSTDCPFVFLASMPDGPVRPAVALSLGGADKIFRSVRARVAGIGLDVTAHRLRHSWMDHIWTILSKAGRQDPIVQDMINYAGGWRPGSQQSTEYAQRAIREGADGFSMIVQAQLVKFLADPVSPQDAEAQPSVPSTGPAERSEFSSTSAETVEAFDDPQLDLFTHAPQSQKQ